MNKSFEDIGTDMPDTSCDVPDAGPTRPTITQLLAEAESGSDAAWEEIYRVLYADIHRIAASLVRQHVRKGHSPTSLISETWIKLTRSRVVATSREHLVSLIARAMRFVLIDQARSALAGKRGEGIVAESMSGEAEQVAGQLELERLLMVNNAFESLARISARLARVVELRYFGGMDETEIADLLGVTERTVRRDWRKARAYLQNQLEPSAGH